MTRTLDELKKAMVSTAQGEKVPMTQEELHLWTSYCSINDVAETMSRFKPPSIAEVLAERGSRYGPFAGHATVTQDIKTAMRGIDTVTNWDKLNHSQREALEMIAHKIGRILNGDPNYLDSWVDIVGYTQLVIDELQEKVK